MSKKIELYILGLVGRNQGKLGWYNVERTVTNKTEFDISFDELMALINSLVEEGFLEARKAAESELPAAYWITEKGQALLDKNEVKRNPL